MHISKYTGSDLGLAPSSHLWIPLRAIQKATRQVWKTNAGELRLRQQLPQVCDKGLSSCRLSQETFHAVFCPLVETQVPQ